MGFVKEFKEFAMKGNVMDMAVGVIIGGALRIQGICHERQCDGHGSRCDHRRCFR